MKALEPLWKYNHEDITTWMYINCSVSQEGEEKSFKKWIINPQFKYAHLVDKED